MAKPINTEKQDEFLVALVATRGNIKAACERIGLDRSSFYDWKKKPEFAEKLTFFIERAEDNIVDEITLPLFNAYMWEAQIQQKARNGEKSAKPTMKMSEFINLGFKLLTLTKKGKEMLGLIPPKESETNDSDKLLRALENISKSSLVAPYVENRGDKDPTQPEESDNIDEV